MRKLIIIICIILIIAIGVFMGYKLFKDKEENNKDMVIEVPENDIVSTIEIDSEEEKTTPNTLMIYKTYYTKCKHFIETYEEIDTSLVNLTEKELKEKCKEWKIENFSKGEVQLSKEEEKYCMQHYKLKLEDNHIVIYNVDENGYETKYEDTDITVEYLPEEDINKLRNGIIVYGKENLYSTIEDYN